MAITQTLDLSGSDPKCDGVFQHPPCAGLGGAFAGTGGFGGGFGRPLPGAGGLGSPFGGDDGAVVGFVVVVVFAVVFAVVVVGFAVVVEVVLAGLMGAELGAFDAEAVGNAGSIVKGEFGMRPIDTEFWPPRG